MSPKNWTEMTAAYVLGSLNPEEKASFEERLASDAELERDVASYREVRGGLAGAAPSHEPPAALKERILVEARGSEASSPQADLQLSEGSGEQGSSGQGTAGGDMPGRATPGRGTTLPWLLAAAGVILSLGLGVAYQRARTNNASLQVAYDQAEADNADLRIAFEQVASDLEARETLLETFLGPDVRTAMLAATGQPPSARLFWNAIDGSIVMGLAHALEMGQETFDHLDGFIEYLDAFDEPIDRESLDELVTMVKDAGSWVVPTLVLWDVGIIGRGDAQALANHPEMRYWPKRNIPGAVEGVEGWIRRHAGAAQQARADPAAADLWANNRLEVLKALSDGGVGMLMGTDSPQIFSVPGFSLHREMQAMAESGMSPYEILVSGTRAVGEYFRRSDTFGTVSVGRRADLILLNANPLDDIGNVTDRAGVMVRGRWFSEGYIQGRLDEISRRLAAN